MQTVDVAVASCQPVSKPNQLMSLRIKVPREKVDVKAKFHKEFPTKSLGKVAREVMEKGIQISELRMDFSRNVQAAFGKDTGLKQMYLSFQWLQTESQIFHGDIFVPNEDTFPATVRLKKRRRRLAPEAASVNLNYFGTMSASSNSLCVYPPHVGRCYLRQGTAKIRCVA
jgi:hypothetical protein